MCGRGVLFLTLAHWHGHKRRPLTCHRREKKKLMEFHANSRSVSFPSSGRPRQTEHVTTPALPSASSFSWQHRLIAEVIRLGKAVLKIKVSHVSQHFRLDGYEAFEGDIHGGRQSAALSSPHARLSLLLLLQGREALKRNFISQRMFCSGSLEKQRGQGSKSPLFLRGSFEARMCKSRGKGFWSYPTATRLQGERRFTSSVIYILVFFFLVAPVCVGCCVVPVCIVFASELWDTQYWQNVFLPLDCTWSLSVVRTN